MAGLPYRVVVNPEKCLGCGECVRACAFGVLEIVDDIAYAVRPDDCRGCGDCVNACQQKAIEVVLVG